MAQRARNLSQNNNAQNNKDIKCMYCIPRLVSQSTTSCGRGPTFHVCLAFQTWLSETTAERQCHKYYKTHRHTIHTDEITTTRHAGCKMWMCRMLVANYTDLKKDHVACYNFWDTWTNFYNFWQECYWEISNQKLFFPTSLNWCFCGTWQNTETQKSHRFIQMLY